MPPLKTSTAGGTTARGSDCDELGTVEDINLDRETGKPERMAGKTGVFGGHVGFVSLAHASLDGDAVTVPYDRATINGAPHTDADGQLSQAVAEADLSGNEARSVGRAGGSGTRGYVL
jgi:hypothetical protein